VLHLKDLLYEYFIFVEMMLKILRSGKNHAKLNVRISQFTEKKQNRPPVFFIKIFKTCGL